jgi:hypothetical protein
MKISVYAKPVLDRYLVFLLDTYLDPILTKFNASMKKEYRDFRHAQPKNKYKPSIQVVGEIQENLVNDTRPIKTDILTLKMSNTDLYLNDKKRKFEYVTFSKVSKRMIISSLNRYLIGELEHILVLASKVVRMTKRNMITDRTLDIIGNDKNIPVLRRVRLLNEEAVEEAAEEEEAEEKEQEEEKEEKEQEVKTANSINIKKIEKHLENIQKKK